MEYMQVWCGSKQKELEANSLQLLDQYFPWPVVLLSMLAPCTDDIGWTNRGPDTLVGYHYTTPAVALLVLTGVLGKSMLLLSTR